MDNNNLIVNRNAAKKTEAQTSADSKGEEIKDEFASAFPSWDLTPPAVVVKRVRRKI